MYVGLSNGEIHYWKKKTSDKNFNQRDCDLVNMSRENSHKGNITCLVYEEKLYNGVIVSGSADGKLKVWVKDPEGNSDKYKYNQSLVEHSGTILAVAVSSQINIIASSSTDKTVRLYKVQPGREFFMYPFYICFQSIAQVSRDIGGMGVWVSSLIWKEGDEVQLLAGDSLGCIKIYKPKNLWKENLQFELSSDSKNVHRLIISQLLLVPQENFVFSLSYDQSLKGLDATNGSEFVCLWNQNRCFYTSAIWDTSNHELILSDEKGYIGVYNVYHEKPTFWGSLFQEERKIIGLALREEKKELLVATETSIELFYMRRGQNSQDIQGHDGPIIKVHGQEAYQIHRLHSNDKPRFISTSMDNTIKVWNFSDLNILVSMNAPQRAEISCMCYLTLSSLIATGHENGAIMLWNPEIQEKIRLRCEPDQGHKNTVTAVSQAYSKDIEFLLSVDYDGLICIWEITEKNDAYKQASEGSSGITVFPSLRNTIRTTKNRNIGESETGHELFCVIFDENRRNILAGGNSSEIQVWSIMSLDFVGKLRGHTDAINAFAIEQNFLYSGSDDKTIKVWDLENLLPLYTLSKHTLPVRDLLFIYESGHLVTCGNDGKIIVWNTQTMEPVKTFERNNHLSTLSFLCIQNVLLVGTEQNTILTVPIEPYLGNINGEDHTVDKNKIHLEKKKKQKRGEPVEFEDDTRSILSEELAEEYPDPAEELLKKLVTRDKK